MGKKGGGNLGRQLARTQGSFFFDLQPHCYCMSKKSWPYLYSDSRHKNGQYFWNTKYDYLFLSHLVLVRTFPDDFFQPKPKNIRSEYAT